MNVPVYGVASYPMKIELDMAAADELVATHGRPHGAWIAS